MRMIQGMPYVPGRARGVLRRTAAPGAVLLATQSELHALTVCPAGVIVVEGAPFSHAMIGLLGLGVPTVMIGQVEAQALIEGTAVIVDGASGVIRPAAPNESIESETPPAPPPGRPVYTVDGVAVELRASVRDAAGVRRAVANGAAAIGLVRSEFLAPPAGRAVDAAFYEQAFAALCDAAGSLAVTLRFLDVSPDKHPAWLDGLAAGSGPLGLQGARLYDCEPVRRVFEAQLAAVARLVARRHLRLLVPYITHLEELQRLRHRIETKLPHRPLFGVMLETPAAALEIAAFCEATDFVALGTNDLMQCLFAADRDQPALRRELDPYAPVLYRFLRLIAEGAGSHLIRVQVCGVLAQLSGVLPVLLGLGFRVFSVDSVFIPYLARTVACTRIGDVEALAGRVCAAADSLRVCEVMGIAAG
jgi:phosphoenolpyruvate-protein kinase (PTS system EI component)